MVSKKPLVSVCITAYQHEKYIRECILSVVSQHADCLLEVLIGDDGSIDQTREILNNLASEYPETIKLHFHAKNLGPSENLRYLVDKAKGDFIAHLDGDDYWLPSKLFLQLQGLNENPDCVAVYANGLVISDIGINVGIFNSGVGQRKMSLSYVVDKGNFLFHSTLMYRSKYKYLIQSIPKTFIDYRIHVRLAGQGNLLHLAETLAAYRISSSSSMMKGMPDIVFEGYWDTFIEAALLGVYKESKNGAGLFWERLFLRSARNMKFKNISKWWRVISKDSTVPLSKATMFWLATRSSRLILPIIFAKLFKPGRRVLYRR